MKRMREEQIGNRDSVKKHVKRHLECPICTHPSIFPMMSCGCMTACSLCVESLRPGWEKLCETCGKVPFLQAKLFSSLVDLSEDFRLFVPCQFCPTGDTAYRMQLDLQNKPGQARRLAMHLLSHLKCSLGKLPASKLARGNANAAIVGANATIGECRQELHAAKIDASERYLAQRPQNFEESEALFAPLSAADQNLNEAFDEKAEAEKRLAKASEEHAGLRRRLTSLFAFLRRLGWMYKEIKFLLLDGKWEYDEDSCVAWAEVLRSYLTSCDAPYNTQRLEDVLRASRHVEFDEGIVKGMRRSVHEDAFVLLDTDSSDEE